MEFIKEFIDRDSCSIIADYLAPTKDYWMAKFTDCFEEQRGLQGAYYREFVKVKNSHMPSVLDYQFPRLCAEMPEFDGQYLTYTLEPIFASELLRFGKHQLAMAKLSYDNIQFVKTYSDRDSEIRQLRHECEGGKKNKRSKQRENKNWKSQWKR